MCLHGDPILCLQPPTVVTESRKYDPDMDDTPIATTNVPIVKTETRTVTYEKDGVPVAIEDITLISSQSHSTRTQLSETTTVSILDISLLFGWHAKLSPTNY